MATYIRTMSFNTTGKFNPKKDDRKVNALLEELESRGGKISHIKVALGGSFWSGTVATYLIIYEAPAALT